MRLTSFIIIFTVTFLPTSAFYCTTKQIGGCCFQDFAKNKFDCEKVKLQDGRNRYTCARYALRAETCCAKISNGIGKNCTLVGDVAPPTVTGV